MNSAETTHTVTAGSQSFSVILNRSENTGYVVRRAINPATGKPWQRGWHYERTTANKAMAQWLNLSTAARLGKPFPLGR